MKATQTSQSHIMRREPPERIADVLFGALSFALWLGFVLVLLLGPRM